MSTSQPQIPARILPALRIIAKHLANSAIDWAITGSLGLFLQGVPVDEVHDIDLQTDEAGAYALEQALLDFSRQPVHLRTSASLQSHFGSLEIETIPVEIMGALQKRLPNGEWGPALDIRLHRRWISAAGLRLPVLALEYELLAYQYLGRTEKAHLIEQILQNPEKPAMSEIQSKPTDQMPDHHGVQHPTAQMENSQYPNETIRLLHERASLRSFRDQKIPDDVLNLVLEAGNHAATGGNLQPWSIIKIQSPDTSKWLAERCGQGFIAAAPLNLVFCIDMHRAKRWAELEAGPYTADQSFRHFWISFQDTIIAAQNICTAADAMGLGSVYIGTIMEFFPELRERLELPQAVFPVVLLCMGYPKNAPVPRKKLGVDVLVHAETYHELDDQALLAAYDTKYDGKTFQITPERLKTIEKVCREAHGEEFARKCIAHINETGSIKPIINYFGLHYVANEMPLGNPSFLQTLQDAGFNWMNEFVKKDHNSA